MNGLIPNISGDNLYKLLAILGVALFISPSFLDREYQTLALDSIDIERDIAQKDREINKLSSQIALINAQEADIERSIKTRGESVDKAYGAVDKRVMDIRDRLQVLIKNPSQLTREKLLVLVAELRTVASGKVQIPGPTYEDIDKQLKAVIENVDQIGTKLDEQRGLLEDKKFDMMKLDVSHNEVTAPIVVS